MPCVSDVCAVIGSFLRKVLCVLENGGMMCLVFDVCLCCCIVWQFVGKMVTLE